MHEFNDFSLNKNDILFSLKYGLLVVDEAHCIDKWGRKFRPAYSLLGNVKQYINKLHTCPHCFSFERVQKEIIRSLGLENCKTVVTGFYRPNIHLSVINLSVPENYGEKQNFSYSENT